MERVHLIALMAVRTALVYYQKCANVTKVGI